jgi:hypothetical protein
MSPQDTPTITPEPASQPAPVSSTRKSKLPLMIIGCVVLGIILVVGALAAGTFYAYQSNTNVPVFSDIVERIEKLSTSDENVARSIQNVAADNITKNAQASANDNLSQSIADTLKGQSAINTASFDVNLEVNNKLELPSPTSNFNDSTSSGSTDVNINFKGTTDVSDRSKIKAQANISGDATIVGNSNYEFAGDTIVIGNEAYLNISKLPSLPFPVDTTMVIGKWIKFDKKLTDQLATGTVTTNKKKITQEDADKIERLIKSESITKSFKRLPDKVIDNVRTNCFEVNMDKAALTAFGKDAADIYKDQSMKTSINSLNSFYVSTCVGRRDHLLYDLTLKVNSTNSGSTSDMSLDLKMRDYNKPVTIEAPANYENAEDVAKKLSQPKSTPANEF